MKAISILLLLCSAASALPAQECCMANIPAAKIVVDHINEHHFHGYKFRLKDVNVFETDRTEEHCIMKMKLHVEETKCHVINPKPYEECELRTAKVPRVVAYCNVVLHVKNNIGTVISYNCLTRREPAGCPKCPVLTLLNDPTGGLSISKAVEDINRKHKNARYYVLKEIGRISTAAVAGSGIGFNAEFVIVETHCPHGIQINIEACLPLCPERARHAFCTITYTTLGGLKSVDCEYYPALYTAVLEEETVCYPHCPLTHFPHFPQPGPDGYPPCNGGFTDYDRALHPICPWPLPLLLT